MRSTWLLLAALLIAPAFLLSQVPRAADAGRVLHDLLEAEWERQMRENPVWASRLGDRRWNDRWPETGLAPIERRHEAGRQALTALRTIDRAALTTEDQLSYDLFERQYEAAVEGHQFRWHLVPLDQRSGIHTTHDLVEVLRFETVQDLRDWTARLRAFPEYMDGTIEVMQEGRRAGILQPAVIIQRVLGQLDRQLAADPIASPYYKPFRDLAASWPESLRAELADQAQDAIADSVYPALERFRSFLKEEYLPAAPAQVGIWQIPNGEEAYAFLARRFTTTDLSPREIHGIGLEEVGRIRGEMEEIMRQVGFTGALQEFFHFLRTDPRFYYETEEELLTAYRATAKRIDPHMVKVVNRLPRMPYGVEPIPAITAPDTTTAYYSQPADDGSRAGTYYVNLYRPEVRPKYEIMALSLHEAVPGHHLQIALAMELDLPNFRRHGGYTAFIEGWALYAESLGEDLGLYDDPYSRFGQLTYEMWRAVRLVVDTGIHALRWDRQRAIDFFMENAPKTEADIVNEIDRYIGWPGQALAYKIGELKIKELRGRAGREMGDRFDLREFHDVVLQNGAVTLDVLEEVVGNWIRERPLTNVE